MGDGSQIVRLCVKGSGVTVAFSIGLEPCLWVEGLGLLMLLVYS